jgi:pimeloyl-ACP methyl ester carboxylesterase
MIGPVAQIPAGNGTSLDLYLLRFGKDGRLESPQTAELAVAAARAATDVFVFSHGWNNVYGDALRNYTRFAEGFIAQRAEFQLQVPADYRPVLIGIVWPSTWFVMDSENGPDIAGGDGKASGEIEAMTAEVTDGWDTGTRGQLLDLVDGVELLTEAQARDVAALLLGNWSEDEDGQSTRPDIDNVIDAWKEIDGVETAAGDDEDEIGVIGGGQSDAAVNAAGGFSLDPRGILRMASVWKMKDRAGDVGKLGVGPLLSRIAKPGVRLHLIGHSFGARVMLSAVAHSPVFDSNPVHSLLLLQPAVNRWCFAQDVAQLGRAAGYAKVPDRVVRPIIATRSTFDQPLHEVFHHALRGDNFGEINAAAVGDTDRYGALGGYPPQGIRFADQEAKAPGTRYDLGGSERVISANGSRVIDGKPMIDGHSDVNSPVTWWALHNLSGA